MKRLLALILVLCTISAFAQTPPTITATFGSPNTATGIKGTLVVDSSIRVPVNMTFNPVRTGSMRYDTVNQVLQIYDQPSATWISGGGGGGGGATNLNGLTDVTLAALANGQLLRYNSGTSQWENWTPTYISSYTETDPIFGASPAAGITGTNITNWNTAFGWGNHATQGYLTSVNNSNWSGTDLSVSNGGTGASTLTGVLIGNGTSAFTGVTGTASQLLRRNAGNTAYEFFTPTYLESVPTLQQVGTAGNSFNGVISISGTTGSNVFANNVVVTGTNQKLESQNGEVWAQGGLAKLGMGTNSEGRLTLYGNQNTYLVPGTDGLADNTVILPYSNNKVLVTSVNGVDADDNGAVTISTGSGSTKFGKATEDATAAEARDFTYTGFDFTIQNLNAGTNTTRWRNRSATQQSQWTMQPGAVTLTTNDYPDFNQQSSMGTTTIGGSLVSQLQANSSTGTTGSHQLYVAPNKIVLNSTTANTLGLYFENLISSSQTKMVYYNPTTHQVTYSDPPAGSGGEANTASNLGGGLANWDSKNGVDLRFNTFNASHFDLATNLISIDAALITNIANGQTAFSWGNHALAGYLTSFTETDPTALKIASNLSDLNNAATARTNLGATTVGDNVFTMTNPSALGYIRTNVNNTVTHRTYADVKTDLALNNVENTALSTWAGSTNITTLGTIATGTWNATTIAVNRGGTGATTLTGILVGNGTSAVTAVTGTANQLLRRNAGNTAYEFFTRDYYTQNELQTSGNASVHWNNIIASPAFITAANLMLGTVTSTTVPILIDVGTDVNLPLFTSSLAGLVPGSGGGTTNFLRADGTFAAPPDNNTNFANADLTATANRTHDFATFDLTINDIGAGLIQSSIVSTNYSQLNFDETFFDIRTVVGGGGPINRITSQGAGKGSKVEIASSVGGAGYWLEVGTGGVILGSTANGTSLDATAAYLQMGSVYPAFVNIQQDNTAAVLYGKDASGNFVERTVASLPSGGSVALDDLTDVVITTPSNGHVLQYNGTNWVNSTVSGSGDVVKVGTPVDNQVGVWTGNGTIEGTTAFTYDGTNLLVPNIKVGGAGGGFTGGYVEFESSAGAFGRFGHTSTHSRFYFTNYLDYQGQFDFGGLSANRIYNFPDYAGTVAVHPSLSGQASQVLAVNSSGDQLEWVSKHPPIQMMDEGITKGVSGEMASLDFVGAGVTLTQSGNQFTVTISSGSMVYPGAGIAVSTGSAWGTSITDNSTNWNTAYDDRLKWDGGATGLNASTGRTSLGLVIGTDVQAFDADLTTLAGSTGTKDNTTYYGGDGTFHTAILTRGITFVSPTASENVTVFYTPHAITITGVQRTVRGSSPSVTYVLNYGTNRESATGTIVASNTATTTGSATLNTTSIPAGSYIWVTTSASSTPDEFGLTINYRQ